MLSRYESPFYGFGISSMGHLTSTQGFADHMNEGLISRYSLLQETTPPVRPVTEGKVLDLAFSNTCNLTCVMCSSHFSSAWVRHDKEFAARHPWRSFHQAWSLSYEDIDHLLPSLSAYERIEVKGGEPLLDKKARYFLKKVSELHPSIPVVTFTNFSLVDEEMANVLSNLENLHLNLSIDGTGKTYEWIRGHSFSAVEQNICKFLKRIAKKTCGFGFVSSYYNMKNILEYWQWIDGLMDQLDLIIIPSFHLIATHPPYLTPRLSPHISKAVSDIEDVKALVHERPEYSEAQVNRMITDLNKLKSLLLSPVKISLEVEGQHRLWHENLVKVRGWDIHSLWDESNHNRWQPSL